MKEENKVRISQCMIVKNEEANIERALSWGRGIVCEQIVVDTGSTDKTVELAASMGAVVYNFPWIDDFAAAKNFAAAKAQGDWLAFLDADEVFAPGDEKKLLLLLENLKDTNADGIATSWMQLDNNDKVTVAGTQIRVFRNRKGLEYRRRIHEQLGWRDGTPMRLVDATKELSILHRGYCGDAWEEKRVSRRNLDLILKELEDHPEDYEMMGYLGDEYYAADRYEEAREWYGSSIAHMPSVLDERDQRSAATFIRLFLILDSRGTSEQEIEAVYHKAVSLLDKEADFDYLMGDYYMRRQNALKAAAYFEASLKKLEKYGSNNRAMLLTGHLKEAYEKLASCLLSAGDAQKAVSYSTAVLQSDPYSVSALYTLLKAFRGEGQKPSVASHEAAAFLKKIYNYNLLKDRLVIMRISEKAGFDELRKEMERLCTAEELELINRKRTEEGNN